MASVVSTNAEYPNKPAKIFITGPLNRASVVVHPHLTTLWHNPHVVQCAGRVEALGGRSMRMAMNCENVQNLARCCV